jgi:hypothetical protein
MLAKSDHEAHLRSFEHNMLQEMSNAVVRIVLVPRTCVYVYANLADIAAWNDLCCNTKTII